eukprot:gene19186-biopygen26709
MAINDYDPPDACIVDHFDPFFFERRIITTSFLNDAALSFGCNVDARSRGEKGSEGWWRSGKGKGKGGWYFPRDVPWREPIRRGEALLMWDYASNEVTHCVRSPDVPGRRFAIIVRVVRHGAPTHTSLDECMRPRVASAPAAAGGAESAPLERQ